MLFIGEMTASREEDQKDMAVYLIRDCDLKADSDDLADGATELIVACGFAMWCQVNE